MINVLKEEAHALFLYDVHSFGILLLDELRMMDQSRRRTTELGGRETNHVGHFI